MILNVFGDVKKLRNIIEVSERIEFVNKTNKSDFMFRIDLPMAGRYFGSVMFRKKHLQTR